MNTVTGNLDLFQKPVKEMRSAASKTRATRVREAVWTTSASFRAAGDTIGTQGSGSPTSPQNESKLSLVGTSCAWNDTIAGARGCSVKLSPEESSLAASRVELSPDRKATDDVMPRMLASSISPTLRREESVMERGLFLRLCFERQLRRHDPAHGLVHKGRDYVYYNHRSKGCYIPRETPKDAVTLKYNHMYDFTNGFRFARGDDASPCPNPSVVDEHSGTFKSLHKVSFKELAESTLQKSAAHSTQDRVSKTPLRQRRETLRTISVDLAHSLQVSQLRHKPFQIPITIEDVIANDRRCVAKVMDGVGSVVGQGKVKWCDLPENLRKALHGEKVRQNTALKSGPASALVAGHRAEGAGDARYAAESRGEEFLVWNKEQAAGRGDGGERAGRRSAPVQPPQRQDVIFTDHADQVLLGFMQNVQPAAAREGVMSHTQAQEGGVKEASGGGDEGKEREEAQKEEVAETKPSSQMPEQEKQACALTPSSLDKERACVLPPIAMASIRDAEWFSPTAPRKVYSGELPTPWSSWIPEKPLPFETSRLRYRRNYDIGDAKPPEGMVHVSTLKELR